MKHFLALCLLLLASAAESKGRLDLFGITARWESPERKYEEQLETELSRIAEDGKQYLDPDCVWRKRQKDGTCPNAFPEKTAELEKLAEELKAETGGYFDIRYKKDRRDFGGIWQGYVLEQLNKSVSGKWLVDLSGDILFRDQNVLTQPIVITDPVFDQVEYAIVDQPRGYVLASVGRGLGGKIEVPTDIKKKGPERILKIVLFAAPSMSGARLDAWTTAIIAGGTTALESLWQLTEYQGMWGYFYFDVRGTAVTSENVRTKKEGKTWVVTPYLSF